MFDRNKGALSLPVAAATIGESVDNARELMYGGFLQGFLTYDGKWWILQESIERWLGYTLNIVQRDEE